ncbi:MAG: ferritin-like domain-containing protein, partial [Nostocaceae cyanobacterium]|nr:ferritin-like domain-containing protein [Nostocaceae cyanobacterium]
MRSIAGLDLPHVSEENKLRRVLSSALKSRLGHLETRSELGQYWDAAYFGLNRVKVFQDATVADQGEILRLC